jgi:hypothetical protein
MYWGHGELFSAWPKRLYDGPMELPPSILSQAVRVPRGSAVTICRRQHKVGVGDLAENEPVIDPGNTATSCRRNSMTLDSGNLATGCSHFYLRPIRRQPVAKLGLVVQDRFLAQLVREIQKPCGCDTSHQSLEHLLRLFLKPAWPASGAANC